MESQPALPIRSLHNFIYCPRLFYYQWVENIFQENADTVEGSHAHRNTDHPSRLDDAKELKELDLPEGSKIRSLRLEGEKLGLIGMVDIIEGGPDGAVLIDYKKGSARRDEKDERVAKEPDAMQVVAQTMLIEEHGISVQEAFVYYAEDKRRVPVDIALERRRECLAKIAEAKALAAQDFLEREVDVSFFAPSGRFLWLLRGLPASGVDARRGQYRLFEESGICLNISREMIQAKIHNQRVMLMRNGEPPGGILEQMAQLRDQTTTAETVQQLFGLEGMAAAGNGWFSRSAARARAGSSSRALPRSTKLFCPTVTRQKASNVRCFCSGSCQNE